VFVICLPKYEAPLSVLLVMAVALMASSCAFIAQYINVSLSRIYL